MFWPSPKRDNHQLIRRLNTEPHDRGKRHFWGRKNGDYGFYTFDDQEELEKFHKHRK